MQNATQDEFLSRITTGFNSELYFSLTGCLNKTKGLSLLYYLSITREKRDWFMPFSRALSEMQPTSSRIFA